MKADKVREIVVSSLFSTCVVGLLSQFMLLERHLEFADKFAVGLLQHHHHHRRHEEMIKEEPPMPTEEEEEEREDEYEDDYDDEPGPDSLKWMEYDPSASGPEPVHVGVIMKNLARNGLKATKLKRQFATLVISLMENAKKLPLHFTILTDEPSVPIVKPILDNYASLLSSVGVEADYFDSSIVADRFRRTILAVRDHFTSNSKQAKKYSDDLFMLAPFYHRVFPFRRMIMLDADLKFNVDIAELYSLFDDFSESEVMGVASDLTPHYRHVLRFYREENPGTRAGEPGRFQGFNTGVVLFDLEKMRASQLYNNVTSEAVVDLAEKYKFHSHLGDQCMYSLIGLEYPELFHLLPCEYNFQMDITMSTQKLFAKEFPAYHYCRRRPKVYHGNGGADIPADEEEEKDLFPEGFFQE